MSMSEQGKKLENQNKDGGDGITKSKTNIRIACILIAVGFAMSEAVLFTGIYALSLVGLILIMYGLYIRKKAKEALREISNETALLSARRDDKVTLKSEEEINAAIENNKKFSRKRNRISKAGIAISLVIFCMFIVTGNPILMFLGCCIVLLGILYGARSSKKAEDAIKEDMEGTVLLPMLESVFENVRYVPQGYIPKERVRRGDLGFTFHYSKFEGSDYIRADYRNVAIEMSDIQLST